MLKDLRLAQAAAAAPSGAATPLGAEAAQPLRTVRRRRAMAGEDFSAIITYAPRPIGE